MTHKRVVTITGIMLKTLGAEIFTKEEGALNLKNTEYDTSKIYQKVIDKIRVGQHVKLDLNIYILGTEENAELGIIKFVKRAFYSVRSFFTGKDGQKEVVEEIVHQPTTVAVLEDGTEVPNVQKLNNIVKHAKKSGNTKGMEALLKRLGKMTETEGFKVEHLLKFLERADLPIADNGDIIAYKSLLTGTGDCTGMFVDRHSRKVPQDIGSLIYMDVKDVDPNSANECSQGLHVARRQYLNNFFRGDACMVIMVRPEDIVAVPNYDANKMRVAAYHIVGKLSSTGANAIFSGKTIEGSQYDERLIADIIAGKHVGIIHRVHIGGPKGTRLTITGEDKRGKKTIKEVGDQPAQEVENKSVDSNVEKAVETAEPVAETKPVVKSEPVKATAKATQKAKAKSVKAEPVKQKAMKDKPASRADILASHVYVMNDITASLENRQASANFLMDTKKKAKKSWKALGLDDSVGDVAKLVLSGEVATSVVVPVDEAVAKKSVVKNNIKAKLNKGLGDQVTLILELYDAKKPYSEISRKTGLSQKVLKGIIRQHRKLR